MRGFPIRKALPALCAALIALCAGAVPAQATEPLYTFVPSPPPPPATVTPPPTGHLYGPCGLAVDSSSRIYVSDYYHDAVDVFTSGSSQLSLPGYVTQLTGLDPLDGPCGLAINGLGSLFVNDFHRSVAKYGASPLFTPGPVFDSATPTGIAVDASNNVYVDDRTYIAVYDSSGNPVLNEGNPLKIGLGTLGDGYGVAVSQFPATLGYLYVPDASTNTVKVYNPASDKVNPVAEIKDSKGNPFISLRDSAIAVDKVTGEIYFADNTQPNYTERPQATIYVYGPANTWKGYLPYQITDALPPGLAVDNTSNPSGGRVYVTSGNTTQAGWYAYPPGSRVTGAPKPSTFSLALSATGGSGAGTISGSPSGIECASSCETEVRSAAQVTLTATPDRGSTFTGWSGGGCSGRAECTVTMTQARSVRAEFESLAGPPTPASPSSVITQSENLRVTVNSKLSPKKLPRKGTAPIAVTVGWQIETTDGTAPPRLKTLQIAINKEGRFDTEGLPTCPYDKIQPASTQRALSNCRSSLVGRGSFNAEIALKGQEAESYETKGTLLVFNGEEKGKPVLFGQIYAAHPFATSFVIPFQLKTKKKGAYGTMLSATLPAALRSWGNLNGIEMRLSRRYGAGGESHSFISAGCPAPKGFGLASFKLARTAFGFTGGREVSSTVTGECRVGG